MKFRDVGLARVECHFGVSIWTVNLYLLTPLCPRNAFSIVRTQLSHVMPRMPDPPGFINGVGRSLGRIDIHRFNWIHHKCLSPLGRMTLKNRERKKAALP